MKIKNYHLLFALIFNVVLPACCKEKVVYYNYSRNKDDTLDTSGNTYPAQRLLGMMRFHPRARYFRVEWNMSWETGSTSKLHLNVLLDRKKKTLRYYSESIGKVRPKVAEASTKHLLIQNVSIFNLRQTLILIDTVETMSPDAYLFLLAKAGCHVTDLRTKKSLFWNDKTEQLSDTRS